MDLQTFFDNSPIARNVKLPGKVVVHRASLNAQEISALRQAGTYKPVPADEEICELEVSGVVIARGKIIRKSGEYYFRVTEIGEEVLI